MAYTVSFSAAALIQGLNLQLEAAISQAVQTVALTTQAAWQQTVLQTPGLWQPIKDRYAASIKVDYTPGRMAARIYSDDPMATPIETGIPARDMKRALDTSLKVRTAMGGKHAGQRYLIIPFRHNTPGYVALAKAMPSDIYTQAAALEKSRVTGVYMAPSGLNASNVKTKGQMMTLRRTYKWGDRLGSGADVPRRFRGMVRFDTSSGKQKSSQYLTFRVMGEWSKGWIVPAQPGRHIVQSIAQQAQQMLNDEVAAAIASAAKS